MKPWDPGISEVSQVQKYDKKEENNNNNNKTLHSGNGGPCL